MPDPKIVVFAYSQTGHACLKFLLERKENVVAVYTHEDKPNEKRWFPSVAELARKFNVPVITDEKLSQEKTLNQLRAFSPDLLLSFYYRNMIPAAVLSMPPLGAYNMHGSLLPRYRGRAPVNWAVLNGEKETGASLHVMVEKPDAGDIVDRHPVKIGPDDTALEVQTAVTAAAVEILKRQIDALKAGRAPRTPQDSKKASYFGGRKPEDGVIDWNWPAARVHNLVRAVTHPYPGATADLFGKKTWIWKTRLTAGKAPKSPAGTARRIGDKIFVTCGDGNDVEILEKGESI